MILKHSFNEFIRFAIVGIIATAIHYGLYLLLLQWINVNIAYTIGYLFSFCCNFVLTNFFTFKTKPNAKKGIGFILSHFINYGLHILLLNLFIYAGIIDKYAPILVYIIVVPVNFLLVRFVFKSKYTAS